jgi:hypothetical protein
LSAQRYSVVARPVENEEPHIVEEVPKFESDKRGWAVFLDLSETENWSTQ